MDTSQSRFCRSEGADWLLALHLRRVVPTDGGDLSLHLHLRRCSLVNFDKVFLTRKGPVAVRLHHQLLGDEFLQIPTSWLRCYIPFKTRERFPRSAYFDRLTDLRGAEHPVYPPGQIRREGGVGRWSCTRPRFVRLASWKLRVKTHSHYLSIARYSSSGLAVH